METADRPLLYYCNKRGFFCFLLFLPESFWGFLPVWKLKCQRANAVTANKDISLQNQRFRRELNSEGISCLPH